MSFPFSVLKIIFAYMEILDGNLVAAHIKAQIKQEVNEWQANGGNKKKTLMKESAGHHNLSQGNVFVIRGGGIDSYKD